MEHSPVADEVVLTNSQGEVLYSRILSRVLVLNTSYGSITYIIHNM